MNIVAFFWRGADGVCHGGAGAVMRDKDGIMVGETTLQF